MHSELYKRLKYVEDLKGKRFCFIGPFQEWPDRWFGRFGPKTLVKWRGAKVVDGLDDKTDFLVVGNGREKGKAALLRKAEALGQTSKLQVLDELGFMQLIRPDISGLSFAFVGRFRQGLGEENGAAAVAAAHGAVIHHDITPELDFLVVGDGRVKGKAAALRQADTVKQAGATFDTLDEEAYLELLFCLSTPDARTADVPSLVLQLRNLADPRRVERALKMLKKDSFQLYTDLSEDDISGIVSSQTGAALHYACWMRSDGFYSCYDDGLEQCMGLQGHICKHLMVLLIGMAKNGDLSPAKAMAWIEAAHKRKPSTDADLSAQALLRYRGVEAGEVDWRPTETVPEDYYTL